MLSLLLIFFIREVEKKRNEVDSHGKDFNIEEIQYAGGLDISFCNVNDVDKVHACVALTVTQLPRGPPDKEPKVRCKHNREYRLYLLS